MRIVLMICLMLGLTACYADRGGAVRVDGVGEARWDGDNYHHNASKGCPPGLAKQGRCY